jgi:hypothetical protein
VLSISQSQAQLAHALRNRLLVYNHVGPHSAEKLLSSNKPACVLQQMMEYFEGLWSQLDVVLLSADTTAPRIEDKTKEFQ